MTAPRHTLSAPAKQLRRALWRWFINELPNALPHPIVVLKLPKAQQRAVWKECGRVLVRAQQALLAGARADGVRLRRKNKERS